MQITLDETKLAELGLTETDVIDTIRRALSTVIGDYEGTDRKLADERVLLDALPDPDAPTGTHTPKPVTDADLDAWVAKVHDMRVADYKAKNFRIPVPPLTVEKGRKYARIVTNHTNQRLVFCFVDLRTGDILKSATWRAPAKYPRGNIFATDPLAGVTVHGAEYLR